MEPVVFETCARCRSTRSERLEPGEEGRDREYREQRTDEYQACDLFWASSVSVGEEVVQHAHRHRGLKDEDLSREAFDAEHVRDQEARGDAEAETNER